MASMKCEVKMEKYQLGIDYDIADKIALKVLIDYRDHLQKELDDYYHQGEYLHPDDVGNNKLRIEALNLIIHDFGGE